jgi:hypothetical protein
LIGCNCCAELPIDPEPGGAADQLEPSIDLNGGANWSGFQRCCWSAGVVARRCRSISRSWSSLQRGRRRARRQTSWNFLPWGEWLYASFPEIIRA